MPGVSRHDDRKDKAAAGGDDDYAFEQGITALTVLSRLHGKAVAPDDVRRHCRKGVFDVAEMLNCGRALGLKLRELVSDWSGLAHLTLPAVGVLRTGGFLFLGQIVEDRVVVADVTSRRPKYMSREELEDIWDGRVITVAPKRTWKDFMPGDRPPAAPRRRDRQLEDRSRTRHAFRRAAVAMDAA